MNISDLTNTATRARTLGNLVLVTPQKSDFIGYQPIPRSFGNGKTQKQQDSLLFHIEGENTVTLDSDITDHYIEDNTAIQDQIALKPEVVTVNGFIGELNDVIPELLNPIKLAAEKITVISGYTPGLSTSALIAYNQAKFLYDTTMSVVNDAVQTWDLFKTQFGFESDKPQNKQQQMFTQFAGYWRNRNLFNVQTPWAMFENMAIKTIRAVQDPETRIITDFQVTFKKINIATTLDFINNGSSSFFDATQFQGRAFNQGAAEVPFGSQVGQESTLPASSLWSATA